MFDNTREVFRWLTMEEYTAIYNRAYVGEGNNTNKDVGFRRFLDSAITAKRRAAKLPIFHSSVYEGAAVARKDRKRRMESWNKRRA